MASYSSTTNTYVNCRTCIQSALISVAAIKSSDVSRQILRGPFFLADLESTSLVCLLVLALCCLPLSLPFGHLRATSDRTISYRHCYLDDDKGSDCCTTSFDSPELIPRRCSATESPSLSTYWDPRLERGGTALAGIRG